MRASAGVAVLVLLLGCLPMFAAGRTVRVCVRDQRGDAIVGARVVLRVEPAQAVMTGASGCAEVVVEGTQVKVEVERAGFSSVVQAIGDGSELTVVLAVKGATEEVQVTASRIPLPLEASASSVRTMSQEQLQEAPGFVLDDRLRQVAGFQLFRRTNSWVSNPTSQGTSLRGLGSTAASRTLVLSDQIPLNDGFGGWIHWNEIPVLAQREVELMRGGASDLYGSSAIGGVIDVLPAIPSEGLEYAADVAGANEATSTLNGLVSGGERDWSGLAAASFFRTDGYVLTAPEVRGPVDVASNVHYQSGRVEVRRSFGIGSDAFLRGNLLNEARSNGTPLQANATRIWRYVGGGDYSSGDVGRVMLRLYGTAQNYRQSFSSVAPGRATEKLTNLQRVPTQQIGGAVQWARGYRDLTLVAGSDVLDTRGTDNETGVSNGVLKPTVSTSARQRGTGIYGEALWQPSTWSIAFSSRGDWFDTFDAKQVGAAVNPVLPDISETVFNPRLGVVKQVGKGVSLSGSAFRAFRGPSLNELYRTGQVGQQITLPNPNLRSERATGFEFGGLVNLSRLGSVRTSYFWTQVNRPVAAVALRTTATSQILQRENLGQLTSEGITTEAEIKAASFLMLTGGYQFAVSTVTKYQANPALVGLWTPQVPRNSASVQARFEKESLGVFSVALRASGRQYDDTANQFKLDGYAQVDLYAEHRLWRNLLVYGSVQNVGGDRFQAGRTPLLTLGAPRIVSAGLRLH